MTKLLKTENAKFLVLINKYHYGCTRKNIKIQLSRIMTSNYEQYKKRQNKNIPFVKCLLSYTSPKSSNQVTSSSYINLLITDIYI